MRAARAGAVSVLALIVALCIFPTVITSDASDEQFRNEIDLPPSVRYPLGTDDLGRNRLSRLLTGTRTSLLLAPAAALLSVLVASIIGVIAAVAGGPANRLFESGADLAGSLPWLFVLIAFRASLPLESPPMTTTVITFAVLAFLGWSGPARVIRNMAANLQQREFALQAQALGVSRWRVSTIHLPPNLWPVALAQFWINIPVFILAEANLGLLGMGVSEPYASLGNQLKELDSYTAVSERPWLLAPAVLLLVIVAAMWVISFPRERT